MLSVIYKGNVDDNNYCIIFLLFANNSEWGQGV